MHEIYLLFLCPLYHVYVNMTNGRTLEQQLIILSTYLCRHEKSHILDSLSHGIMSCIRIFSWPCACCEWWYVYAALDSTRIKAGVHTRINPNGSPDNFLGKLGWVGVEGDSKLNMVVPGCQARGLKWVVLQMHLSAKINAYVWRPLPNSTFYQGIVT